MLDTIGKDVEIFTKLEICEVTYEKVSLFTVIYYESIGRYLGGLILFIGYIMIRIDSKKTCNS